MRKERMDKRITQCPSLRLHALHAMCKGVASAQGDLSILRSVFYESSPSSLVKSRVPSVYFLYVIQCLISSLPMNPIFKGHKGPKVELETPGVMYY